MLQDFLNNPALLIFSVTVLFLSVLGPITISSSRQRRRVSDRLGNSGEKSGASNSNAMASFRFVESIGRRMSEPGSQDVTKLQMRLIRAGYFSKSAPFYYLGIRLFFLVAMQGVLVLVWPFLKDYALGANLLTASVVAAVLGYLLPTMVLDKQIEKRKQQYRDGFPDMMDLLVACIQAGLSLDAAVMRISDELRGRYPDLANQLHLMTLEMRAGRDRKNAWMNFATRLGLEEARALATMLKQSEELGTSVGDTLRVFADDMREKRMLLAEEKALALPAKLVLPLIGFVFPSLLLVLILPAVVRMSWVFEAQGAM